MAIPLAGMAPAVAAAADAGEVAYNFAVDGSSVVNTITNSTGVPLTCGTALAPAPDGVLPPVADVVMAGQTIFTQGQVAPGVTTQTVTAIPDGSYVVMATCGRYDATPAMWVSAYPGIEEYLTAFQMPAFTVDEASPVITIPGPVVPGTGIGAIFGS
ncbi:hypothetical protein [Prescottella subtropica]|uniref:hypothetical protein n=1 Tax=Prescottella subtropica TaxID=2545757 RepID=UPI001F50113A|nr:hypothetical protein [Prescottella subtropica]